MLAIEVNQSDAVQLAQMADGLFLTGGVDVNPQYYGETQLPTCGTIDLMRDRLELLLVQAFLDNKKPIFGVCRGIQMINVVLGGTLHQDITTQLKIHHDYNTIHSVTAVTGLFIHRLFGTTFITNSLHHQSIKQLGKGLVTAAYSGEGAIVEAVIHQTLPIMGVQWHPERMIGHNRWTAEGPDMLPLFKEFVSTCFRVKAFNS